MNIQKVTLLSNQIPEKLRNIPDPPRKLFTIGADVKELISRPCVAIVGSRKVSAYGRAVTERLASELVKAGVIIISGLAIGVDSLSHRAALAAGGVAVAVLPCGLDQIYPSSHRQLALEILEKGGALVTEYPEGSQIYPSNFVERNRLISGLSDAVLITEAGQKSGSLHTANFGLEQGREVLAVPGNITSPTSVGTNNLIRTGAGLVTSVEDVLQVLGIERSAQRSVPVGATPEEQTLLDLLASGVSGGEELLTRSQLEVSRFNQALTMLEIRGVIRPLGNNQWRV